ncbi:MAG: sigma 54-interacting transcriptional regulator [Clostridiales Family XIII bacterium]|nr:sigma 54-interacting transcriptional regulator [Clostridiales Family XIII bacterium]
MKNREMEDLYENIIKNSPNGIIAVDDSGLIKLMNRAVEKFFGISFANAVNKKPEEIIPEFSSDMEEGVIRLVKARGQTLHVVVFPLKTGKNKSNGIVRVFFLMNVSESLLLKDALNRQKLMLEETKEILEGSHDGILVTDGSGEVIFVNSSYERIAEIKKEDLQGKNMRDLINPVWMPNSVAFVVIERRCTVSKKQVTKSGKNIIVTGRPIFDKRGNIKMIVINARDISEIYGLREELLKSLKMEEFYMKNHEEFTARIRRGEGGLLAASKKMQDVLSLAERVANFQTTVLILGESGVGKEEVAKYIHVNSIRRDKPFVAIDCGAIPSNLLESELFGYEKGAFTGAVQTGKAGLLEAAAGGVAFLDEIGETSLEFQVKLLRVLETKELRRVGSTKGSFVDVRILAATNRNLEQMVVEGTFREDLFYRLNVVQIHIPPLRNRREDIAPLSMLFLAMFNNKYNQSKTLTYDVLCEMEKHPWHGNVRELKNVVERMVIMSNNDYLQPDDLPWSMHEDANRKMINIIAENSEMSLQEALESLEKSILERTANTYRSTREIAEKLRVNQSTIVRKLHKYKLARNQTD